MILHGYLFYLDSNQTLFAVHTLIIHCTLFFLELVQESLEQDFCLHLPSLVSLESIINNKHGHSYLNFWSLKDFEIIQMPRKKARRK